MKCQACGAEIANDAEFCNYCGEKVEQSQNTGNESVEEAVNTKSSEDKYTGREIVDRVAKFITGGLAFISGIMAIGAFFGFFDKNPVPFLILICVVCFVDWLEKKLPKLPTIFFALFEIIALIICFNISSNVGTVSAIKEGSPDQYPNITYGQAFDDYFANPKWETCGQDEDGNEIVKFTGTCTYLDSDAVAEVKFKIYEEQDSFVVSSVKLNGQDYWMDVLLTDVFEEYQNSH